MNFSVNKNRIIAFIGLLSISWLLINNSVFLHYHKLDDGSYVVHAHPFNKSAEKSDTGGKHQHTNKELLVINFVNTILISIIMIAGLSIFLKIIVQKIYTSTFLSFLDIFLDVVKARPPPACKI